MKRRSLLAATALSCMVGLALIACAPAAQLADTGSDEPEEYVGSKAAAMLAAKSLPEGAGLEELNAAMQERAKDYAPEVRTLKDGTQVQLTPDVTHGYFLFPDTPTQFNTYYMNADERGCDSCHTEGLADLMNHQVMQKHIEFDEQYGTDVTPMQCKLCHDVAQGYTQEYFEFGNLIHGIHSKLAVSNSCMTCHTATADGNGLRLWEESKYEVIQGVTMIDAEELKADITWEQDTKSENMFLSSWMSGENNQAMSMKEASGEPLDPEVFDNWEIAVTGKVDNPYTIKLPDLIAEAPSETFVSTQQCGMNPAGGDNIVNVEVTGIPLSWLLEKAGVQEGATAVMATAPDGWARGNLLTKLAEREGYLVYEINGERLQWGTGYPARMWYPGQAAQNQIRWTGELNVVDTPVDEIKQFSGWELTEKNTLPFSSDAVQTKYDAEGVGQGYNKPNAGIFHLHEGEILPAGEAHEFEGYAYGMDTQIVAVEFSMDNGKTWTRCDTADSDMTRWVYWHFNFTPEEPGAYVLSVRGVTGDGRVGYLPDTVMFNAK